MNYNEGSIFREGLTAGEAMIREAHKLAVRGWWKIEQARGEEDKARQYLELKSYDAEFVESRLVGGSSRAIKEAECLREEGGECLSRAWGLLIGVYGCKIVERF